MTGNLHDQLPIQDTVAARRTQMLAAILIVAWLALAAVFVSAPLWSRLRSSWPAIWSGLALDPPSSTRLVADAWTLVVQRFGVSSAFAALVVVIAQVYLIKRIEGRAGIQWKSLRLLLVAVPAASIIFTVFALHYAPRHQLARTLALPRLPNYRSFDAYRATAKDASNTISQRRQAIGALDVMCWLEKIKLSPPADPNRDSTLDAVETMLAVCSRPETPAELQLFAAATLHNDFIEGRLATYPAEASVDRARAQALVIDCLLNVVADGGPSNYESWQGSALLPRDWARANFNGLSLHRQHIHQLRSYSSDPNPHVQAEAAAALDAARVAQPDSE